MAGFYYTRQYGPDGQVLCGEGQPGGMALSDALARQKPGLRSALELGAALGDILCIAAEDGAVHGDLTPAWVTVAENGDVSLGGFGVPRGGGRAPERRGDAASVDLFGLGLVVYEAIRGSALPSLAADADGHDDAVVTAVLSLDFSRVSGRRWIEEVQRFLARLLAWAPGDRPAALDAANVLGSVAAQVPDEGLDAWCRQVMRAPATALEPPSVMTPLRALPEILDSAQPLSAPFRKGAAMRQAPAAKGESTSFWSRDRIAQMLQDEDDEDEAGYGGMSAEVRAPRGSPGLDAPREVAMPRPPARPAEPAPRVEVREEPSFAEGLPKPPRSATPPEPERPRPAQEPTRPTPAPEPTRPRSPAPDPVRPKPAPPPEPEPEAEAGGGRGMLFAAGGAVFVFAALCGLGALAAGGWYWWSTQPTGTVETPPSEPTTTATPTPEPTTTTTPAEPPTPPATTTPPTTTPPTTPPTTTTTTSPPTTPTTTTTTTSPPPTPTTSSKPATTSSTTKTTTSSTTTTSSKPTTTTTTSTKPTTTTTAPTTTTTSTKPTTATQPTFSNFTVKFVVSGQEGKIVCGDGQQSRFAGSVTLSFTSTQSCRIDAGGARGGVTVSKAATVNCTVADTKLTCSGA